MNRSIKSQINQMERRKKEVFGRYVIEILLGFGSLIVAVNIEVLMQLALGSLLVLVFSAMYDLDKYCKLEERIEALKELQAKLLEVE